MARPGFRTSDKQVQAWIPLTLHIRMKKQAEASSLSLQDWMVEAFREKTGRHDDGTGTRSGIGCAPAANLGGPGPTDDGSGADTVGVVADPGSFPFLNPLLPIEPQLTKPDASTRTETPDWAVDILAAKNTPVPVSEPVTDPWDLEGQPAGKDSRGRILSPQIRDPFIDLP